MFWYAAISFISSPDASHIISPICIPAAIAGESGIPGRLVGSIDMYDKYTFVEVPKEQADIVMDAINHVKIKGKSVHVEKANRR